MQTIVYQCDTAMPAQKLPNCCGIAFAIYTRHFKTANVSGVLYFP